MYLLCCRTTTIQVPGDIVYNVGLQQEVTTWKQVFSDEVLVGPHSYTITHTKRAQDIQDLKADITMFKCGKAEHIIHTFIHWLIVMEPNTITGCYILNHHLQKCLVNYASWSK